jgi:GTP pyrophosphokinase
VVGKDEFSLRTIETLLHPPEPAPTEDEVLLAKKSKPTSAKSNKGGVLVVGVDSLMTQLAKCCKPAPPDAISGFVTRGKGVSIHRRDCANFRELAGRDRERVIEVEWGRPKGGEPLVYPVDIAIVANDRPGTAARHLRSVRQGEDERHRRADAVGQGHGLDDVHGRSRPDSQRLGKVLSIVRDVGGVESARRR